MKRKIALCIFIFIMLQVAKRDLIENYIDTYGESRIEIGLNESTSINYSTISLQNGYEELQPTVVSVKQEILVENHMETVIGTTSNWMQVDKLQMVQGSFFLGEMVEEGRNVVVISDDLASREFGSQRVEGKIIHIDKVAYKIIGIYKKYRNLTDYIVDDAQEYIYIPITSEVARNWNVKGMIIGTEYMEKERVMESLEQMQINTNSSFISNLINNENEVENIAQMPIVLCALLISCSTLLFIRKLIIKREQHVGKKSVGVLLAGVLIWIILCRAWAGIYISSTSMPSENIFDITFYLEYFHENVIVYNNLLQLHFTKFGLVTSKLKNILWFINIVQIICCMNIYIVCGRYRGGKLCVLA